jgi:hypothetical protein
MTIFCVLNEFLKNVQWLLLSSIRDNLCNVNYIVHVYPHTCLFFATKILHKIQVEASRCSCYVDKVSRPKALVCEKVEGMEHLYMSISY